MEVRFDFTLNAHRYGVVEQAIFKMVLRGIESSQAISELLWIFSDSVKASAFQKLVNGQILHANLSSNRIRPSDGVLSVIRVCHASTFEIEMPSNVLPLMTEGAMLIEDRQIITNILHTILPSAKIDYLASSLSFRMSEVSSKHG